MGTIAFWNVHDSRGIDIPFSQNDALTYRTSFVPPYITGWQMLAWTRPRVVLTNGMRELCLQITTHL